MNDNHKSGKLLRTINYVDYLVSGGCIVYGWYADHLWLVAGGVLGLILAYLNLGARLQAALRKKLIRKQTSPRVSLPVAEVSDGTALSSLEMPAPPTAVAAAAAYRPRSRYKQRNYAFGRTAARKYFEVPQRLAVPAVLANGLALGIAPRPDQMARR